VIINESQSARIRRSLSVGSLISGLLLVALFMVEVDRPLSHTDLWGHLAYGRHYEQKGFPETEPFLKHSTDSAFIATSWFSQWLGFRIHQLGGTLALQFTHSLLVTGAFIAFLIALRRKTHSHWAAMIGAAWLLWLEHQQYTVIRPQLAGLFCNLLFLNILLSQRHLKYWSIVSLGVLSFCWANLHGSFVIALVTIVLIITGHGLDLLRRQHQRGKPVSQSLRSVLKNSRIQQLCTAFGVILCASLLTPYGMKLWWEVASFSQSSNLYDLIEWKPLWKTPKQGTVVLISTITVAVLLLMARPPIRFAHWLPVLVLGALMLKTSRYIVWWAPLFVMAAIPTLCLIARRSLPPRWREHLDSLTHKPVKKGMYLLAILVVVVGFIIPSGMGFTGNPEFISASSFGPRTPIEASRELSKISDQLFTKHSDALLFNTMEWGDWLIWSSEDQLPVFVYSHVPLIEEQAWRDYMAIIRQSEGWKERWGTYPFRAALIDRKKHKKLVSSLTTDPAWTESWRDERAIIFILTEEFPKSLSEN
jgi:hypothetical protein